MSKVWAAQRQIGGHSPFDAQWQWMRVIVDGARCAERGVIAYVDEDTDDGVPTAYTTQEFWDQSNEEFPFVEWEDQCKAM